MIRRPLSSARSGADRATPIGPSPGASLAWLASLALVALVALPSCRTAAKSRVAADEQVYAILGRKLEELHADVPPFTVEAPPDSMRQRLLSGEQPPVELGLADLLAIASENSREYRRRQELLYLQALDLTFERYLFRNHYQATADAGVAGDLEETAGYEGSFGAGFTRLFANGAELMFDATFGVVRNLAAGGDWGGSSLFLLSFTKPLLRGSSREVVLEPLTQAERDVVYAVRDFERFRHTFAIDVATRLYRILQQMDTIENEVQNEEGLRLLRERNEALGEAGRIADIQVDQALQDELRAKSRVIEARQRLESLLDDFKLFLGLPIETPLDIRREELRELAEAGLPEQWLAEPELAGLALAWRADYVTAVDRVVDQERRVRVAEDALGAGLKLTTAFAATGDGGKVLKVGDKRNTTWSAGLELDLPLDRFAERNAVREAQLAVELARRDEQELGDEIRADVRQALRDLAAARESYGIQANSVQLAENRIESTRLSFEAGRAETRDLLEAQEAQLQARNEETRALIDYTLARLALVRDVGLLRVGPDGLGVDELFSGAERRARARYEQGSEADETTPDGAEEVDDDGSDKEGEQ